VRGCLIGGVGDWQPTQNILNLISLTILGMTEEQIAFGKGAIELLTDRYLFCPRW
jgi:hypothetical protein